MDNQTELTKKRYNRISKIYNLMDQMIKKELRINHLSGLKGKVLEVGIGTGKNLAYYPKDIHLTGIDFSPGMLRFAKERIKDVDFPVELIEMDAQSLDFDDNTFDYVVTTCVYCSVPDPIQGLKEMRRVVKPDGKIIMLEHMRSDSPILGFVMDVFNPLVVRMSGANINRQTTENIKKAGLIIEKEERLMGSILRRFVINPNK
ncbi:methyltransferase type 11 [Vulcanibacillus modesticaldus]|uniref:Methyltransferase type 11 n=1 Tax=Vulcanibacillus modesticaldus TaxID=337097 RepID=A0A1D2YV55_9BACI|nr:class I SAM-dependent methyltransferase [Vulcanibacillus modesticaldus]OEF99567.1 methyltransferase type 11 [Vulcanibacillus modesticaldus]